MKQKKSTLKGKKAVPMAKKKKVTYYVNVDEGGNNEGMYDFTSLKKRNDFLLTIITPEQYLDLLAKGSGSYGPYKIELS